MARLALDLDGTLIDARLRHVALARHHLVAFGEDLDDDAFWRLKRDGLSTRAALETLGHTHAAEVAQRWGHDIEDPRWLALDPWLPGVREVLVALATRGLEVVILTARKDERALRAQLEHLGVTPLVRCIRVVDPAHAASEKSFYLKNFDLFIGDTESDAEAARLADIPFIAVASGVRSRAFLEARGLTVVDDLHAALSAKRWPTAEAPPDRDENP